MNITSNLINQPILLGISGIGFLGILGYIIKSAPWKKVFAKHNVQQHLFFILTLVLIFIWNIKTGIKPGLSFHILGGMLLTLLFEWQIASISLMLVVASSTFLSNLGWSVFPINAFLFAILPCFIGQQIFNFADRKFYNNIFVYIFINAFLGSAIVLGSVGIVTTLFLLMTTSYSYDYLSSQYLIYYVLMGWSEAFLTGMFITLIAVYKPNWLSTFDDDRYLKAHQE